MIKPTLVNLNRIEKLTRRILQELVSSHSFSLYSGAVSEFFSKVRERVAKEAKGRNVDKQNPASDYAWRKTINWVKSNRIAALRFISGRPLQTLEGVELDVDGWPVLFKAFKVRINSREELLQHLETVRILMTLMISLKYFCLKPVADTTSITEPSPVCGFVTRQEHSVICKHLGITPKNCSWDRFHVSVKSGPMGPALESAVYELPYLTPVMGDIQTLAGAKLASWIQHFSRTLPGRPGKTILSILPKSSREPCLRKLAAFSDKEGKTRIIGICDYWTQTACKPLHEAMTDILKAMETDCTYNQQKAAEASLLPGPYYSYDLSNATDRMPLSLQKRVVSEIIGESRAEAWGRLLSDHPFRFSKEGKPHDIKYEVGQPMGAYSS